MKKFLSKSLVGFLVGLMTFSPGLAVTALAQDAAAKPLEQPTKAPEAPQKAPEDQAKLVRQLAGKGYLGAQKALYQTPASLTASDITDALLRINEDISGVELKTLNPENSDYDVEDLQALLKVVEAKAEDIRARKVSAWKFENRLKKMIAALSESDVPEVGAAPTETSTPVPPTPTFTATPVPGPTKAEWNDLKEAVSDLTKKTEEIQRITDKKLDEAQRVNTDVQAANKNSQEQLQLVKRLIDEVQSNLKKLDDRLEEVSLKASKKAETEEDLQQELTVMHKDLRDDTQDISILKQEFAKLDKADGEVNQSGLDQVLTSKWLVGGALLIALGALTVALTKK